MELFLPFTCNLSLIFVSFNLSVKFVSLDVIAIYTM